MPIEITIRFLSERMCVMLVHLVNNAWEAKLKVHIVQNSWEADQTVGITGNSREGTGVYIVNNPWEADMKIFIDSSPGSFYGYHTGATYEDSILEALTKKVQRAVSPLPAILRGVVVGLWMFIAFLPVLPYILGFYLGFAIFAGIFFRSFLGWAWIPFTLVVFLWPFPVGFYTGTRNRME
ncbi:MAG TPA: hypothetical protein VMR16_00930 [Candidatus Saccharimonadales bacterium]|nr:hypothetical protein [Candidatus Saccharimonadales bacterium]